MDVDVLNCFWYFTSMHVSASHIFSFSQQKVAIKILQKTRMKDQELDRAKRETEILSKLQHPHIAKLYEVVEVCLVNFLVCVRRGCNHCVCCVCICFCSTLVLLFSRSFSFFSSVIWSLLQTDDALNIVMEFAGRTLLAYVLERGGLGEADAHKFFVQILSAIHYCHKMNIIHRDIKHQNILLDDNDNCKLIDFGLSNFMEEGRLRSTFCGTPAYAAPEMVCL